MTVVKREKIGIVKRVDVYNEFILWSAMPHMERIKLGIETQGQFCEYHKIGVNTPTSWKARPDFEARVDKILAMWAVDKTPDVVHGIYRAAVKGNPMSQMLWLQYFKRFSTKQADADEEKRKKVDIGINHIIFIINGMPEPLRSEHHANIRKLIDDAQRLRHAGQFEDRLLEAQPDEPESGLQGEADNDAQVVSSTGTHEVASRHTDRVCTDLGRTVSTYHHQSTSRRW